MRLWHDALLGIRGQAIFVDPLTKVVIVFIAVHAVLDMEARREQYALFYGTLRALRLQHE